VLRARIRESPVTRSVSKERAMKKVMRWVLAAGLAPAAFAASASFHTFQVEQIFSNADGTIQYIVLHEFQGMNGENMLSGHTISATQGAVNNTYTFIMDLPGGECDGYGCSLAPTANRRALIATQGFAALKLVTPDYVVPNGFLPLGKATINYAGYDFVTYSGLPADGVSAMTRTGAIVPNVATNFAGQSASVNSPGNANFEGLWWASPASSESGWGINFAHQGDTIFASWFTYDLTGKGLWLVMTAQKGAPNVYSGLLYTTTGPPFNAVPFDPSKVVPTQVGSAAITFTNANNASFNYTVNGITQTKAITRQVFGTLPACATATGSLAAAPNYQDLWWATPAGSESGWGINLTHQDDTIFATWFTYDLDHTPMWLVVTATKSAPGVYTGTLYRTTGPPFNAIPFNPGNVISTPVGTATFTFSDGNTGSFAYTVNGVAQAKAITREILQNPGTTCH
jgi:hypothetical protein